MTSLARRFRWESLANAFNVFAIHTAVYRVLGGRLVGRNILILSTVGRKSGRVRSTPLFFVRDRGDYVVVASNGGEERHPGWWHNVRSDPNVTIQVGRAVIRCRAEVATAADAPRLWSQLDAVYGGYRRYRAATTRELTIFRLQPAQEDRVPTPMVGAWHVDVHRGTLPATLAPSALVAAVFNIPETALAVGDEVQTVFGKFAVEDLCETDAASHVLLRTWAPGSISRFAITARRTPTGECEATLHNSVHPTSWVGRLYFRTIEGGHHLAMRIALRRLASAARRSVASGRRA